jgi:vitamin B12 transporter
MQKLSLTIHLFFICFISSAVLAQENIVQKTDTSNVYKLTDVVITANRTNTNTLELANSISVIDSVEIANKKNVSVFNLLKNEYGLSTIQTGPLGGLSTISIRGANAGHTLVLIDGVEMNLPSDASTLFDFANLPVESIDRIEVLRGPQSTLYGSDALAGVVNIITRKGIGKPKLNLIAEGGSFNSFKGSAGLTGNHNKLNYLISFAHTQSDGFSAAGEKYGNTEKDGYNGNNISSRFGYDFNSNAGINLFIRFTKANADLDQFGGEFGDDPSYISKVEEFTTRAEGFFRLFDGLWEQKIGTSFYKNARKYSYDSTFNNPVSSRNLYDGKKFKADWQNNFHLAANNLLTFGVESEIEQATTFSSYGPEESMIPKSQVTTTGIYLQDQVKVVNNLFATAGIRYDHNQKFGGAFTYRIAPAYIIWQTNTKLKATIGTGFKAPSIFYLYDPFFGNDSLDTEKNFGWDFGFEQFIWENGVSFGITYFSNEFTNLIGFDENFKSINIDKAETKGVELFASAKPIDNLVVKANYTYTDSKDLSDNSPDKDKPLLRRPMHKAGLYFDFSFMERANANLEIIFIGNRDDKDFSFFPAERITLDGYTLVNVSAHYDLFKFLRVYGRFENLLNVEYEEVLGYGTPKLSGFAGFKVIL